MQLNENQCEWAINTKWLPLRKSYFEKKKTWFYGIHHNFQFDIWIVLTEAANQFSLYPLLRASKKIILELEEEVDYIISKYKNRWDAILVIDGCNQENKKNLAL